MTETSEAWLSSGRGNPPRVAWTFGTDAPIAGFSQSRETGESLVADEANGLYLLDRTGRVVSMNRGFHHLSHVAWSDNGIGAVAVDGHRLCLVDTKLKEVWSIDFPCEILGLAMTPHGGHVAVALSNASCAVHDANANRVSRFTTPRPLHHLEFVVEKPELVVAADYGYLGRHALDGTRLWEESILSNVGGLGVDGRGDRVLVAAFNRGILLYGGSGRARATFAIEGTPCRISLSYDAKIVAAATVEGHLYWITIDGDLRWGADLPEPVAALHAAPLGNGVTVVFESGRLAKLTWGL